MYNIYVLYNILSNTSLRELKKLKDIKTKRLEIHLGNTRNRNQVELSFF